MLPVYQQLKGSPNIVRSDDIVADAADGRLPELSMVWHDSPYDEHPVADVSKGQDKIWQAVDAIVTAGLWDTTVFLLSLHGPWRGRRAGVKMGVGLPVDADASLGV